MEKADAVVGLYFGDEGKGRNVDFLAEDYDIALRCTGGNNAGHTTQIGDNEFKLHLVPSGALREGVIGVIGNGVVIDLAVLFNEIDELKEKGINANVMISDKAHIIMPYHIQMDELQDRIKVKPIGTTKRGIGPCYSDKMQRTGIRVEDFISLDFTKMAIHNFRINNKIFKSFACKKLDYKKELEKLKEYVERLRPLVGDTVNFLHDSLKEDKKIIVEGAQAALLDIDLGTYPDVTSSNPTIGGILTGSGLNAGNIGEVYGIFKAHSSRVGEGPFPTEENSIIGDKIREIAHEFGTTTNRPRRCGWLDAVALQYACLINGVTILGINHLDSVGKLSKIFMCTSYEYEGEKVTKFNPSVRFLEKCKPMYEEFEGNFGDISDIRKREDLPTQAQAYLNRIEEITNQRIGLIGVGKEREQIIDCRGRVKK